MFRHGHELAAVSRGGGLISKLDTLHDPRHFPDDIDQAALLAELRHWVELETHTPDADAVNRLADRVEEIAKAGGLLTERTPGTMGFGDILAVRSPRPAGSNEKSTLILAHPRHGSCGRHDQRQAALAHRRAIVSMGLASTT